MSRELFPNFESGASRAQDERDVSLMSRVFQVSEYLHWVQQRYGQEVRGLCEGHFRSHNPNHMSPQQLRDLAWEKSLEVTEEVGDAVTNSKVKLKNQRFSG